MRVLITGCSRGIGRATAKLLSRSGHEVIATARHLDDLEDLDCSLRLAMDVAEPASVTAAVLAAGRVDAVVNNAGIGIRGPIETITAEALRSAYEVNVFGMLRVVQAVLPQMRERRSGRIVTISSVAGRRSMPLVGHYAATKHALEALSEALRYEVAPWQIMVSLIEPSGVRTEFSQQRLASDAAPEVMNAYADVTAAVERHARQANGSAATADDIAATIRRVLETETPPLRVPATDQARAMIEERRTTSDDDFERRLLDAIGLRPVPAEVDVS
jgi:NADP-dependent 3-hydroxy acid dehydrogenase YdfG